MADGYTVTDVKQRTRFTAGGGRVSYYDITVTTEQGATGTLRIVSKDYSPETVTERLSDFVKDLNMPFEL